MDFSLTHLKGKSREEKSPEIYSLSQVLLPLCKLLVSLLDIGKVVRFPYKSWPHLDILVVTILADYSRPK